MLDNVRRISRQLAAYGTADVAILAINALLLPVYTRVLSAREYGALALLLVCEAFLKPVFRWGLDSSFLRFYYDCEDPRQRRDLASTIALFWLAANGLLLVVLVVSAPLTNRTLVGTAEFVPAFLLLVSNSFLSTFLFLPFGLLRVQERATAFATLSFVRSFGTVIGRLVLVVGLRTGVVGVPLADVIVTGGLLVWSTGMLRSMVGWRFSAGRLRELLRYGLPQVPHGLLSQTMALSDRFLLGLFLPLQQVGWYLIGATIASLLKLFPVAFETVWMPFAFDSLKRRDAPALFARMSSYAFAVLVFLTSAIATLSESAIRLFLPEQFQPASRVVPLLALGIAIQSLSWFFATSLNIAKQTHVYPVATGLGAVVSVAANVLLIPRFGLIGAAAGTLLGQAAATGCTGYFAQRLYPIPYPVARLVKVVAVGAGLFLAAGVVSTANAWVTLVGRAGLMATFPLALFLTRFFEPIELAEVRKLLAFRQAGSAEARTSVADRAAVDRS